MTRIVLLLAISWLAFIPAAEAHRPVAVELGTARCADCQMAIRVRRFVSQLRLENGDVLNFDDPGCLFHTWVTRRPRVAARFFVGPDGRWIRGRDVAFAVGGRTPMGYGLSAVRRSTPGAISWEEAWKRVEQAFRSRAR